MVIAGTVFVMVILAALTVVYFYPKASCVDNRQNQSELGVDCGGPCTAICKEATLPLSIEWTRPMLVAPGVASVVAYIINPNILLGAEDTPYIVRLYDDKNLLIAERRGSAIVLPNQSFPIFEGGIPVGSRIPVRAYFEFTSFPVWQKRISPSFSVENIILTDELSSPRLSASLRNNGLVSVKEIEVVAVSYDNNANAIAASETLVDAIPKGGSAEIVFTWPQPFPQISARTEIYPKALLPL